ncbi:pyrroloquinoline quinone precursor peptide PqqA [Halomonas qinghailakensis]|nr:pyrroloquinoline quinone precursor peptide PqqA [Halomonas sp. ZZQ-149]
MRLGFEVTLYISTR